MKRCIAITILTATTIAFICIGRMALRAVSLAARQAFNANTLARIESSIAEAVLAGTQTNNIPLFVADNFSYIHIRDNQILDFYTVPTRWLVKDQDDKTFFVGVYSAGDDRQWDTADDLTREGIYEKNAQ